MAEKVLEQIMVGIFTNLAGHIDLQIEQFSEPQFSSVAQSCPTRRDPMDCSPPGSSIHGIFQARVLEWGAIAFSLMESLLRYN